MTVAADVRPRTIAVLAGDGIGPEVTGAAVDLLVELSKSRNLLLEFREGLLGGAAIEATGVPLPAETLALCEHSDALLVGAVGGPLWDAFPAERNPGLGGLLRLRRHFDLYANLRPGVSIPGPPDSETTGRTGIDILLVREAAGGAYFSPERGRDRARAWDTIAYSAAEIRRVVEYAVGLARTRSRRLTSIDKANVLESSRLWREVAGEVLAEAPDVQAEHLYVDNAAMQMVLRPETFDVIVTENMFGDILSDEIAGLVGSLGTLPSATLRSDGFGLYEPVHGSAPSLAGTGTANPCGAILSGALMLRYSFGLEAAARDLETACLGALRDGVRTPDIALSGHRPVSTTGFADAVRSRLVR